MDRHRWLVAPWEAPCSCGRQSLPEPAVWCPGLRDRLLASRATFAVSVSAGREQRVVGLRVRGKGGRGEGPSPPCGLDAATLGRAADELLKRKRQDVPSTSEVVFACLIFAGWGSRVKGQGVLTHPNPMGSPLGTPLRKHRGTILELGKASWVLNSGLIRSILVFDLVYSQEKTKLRFLF